MIDRFRGAAGPLAAPATPGDRAGGTLDGVRAALEAGYFERARRHHALALAGLHQPERSPVGRDGHLYAAYHGYWPDDPRAVDPPLGGEAALDALVAAAHARGLRVLVRRRAEPRLRDAPVLPGALARPPMRRAARDELVQRRARRTASAATPGCDWGAHIETCWFAPYLPDLNWRDPDVARRRHRRSRLVDVALRSRRAAHRRGADDAARRQRAASCTPCAR